MGWDRAWGQQLCPWWAESTMLSCSCGFVHCVWQLQLPCRGRWLQSRCVSLWFFHSSCLLSLGVACNSAVFILLCACVGETEDLLGRISFGILLPSQCVLEFLSLPLAMHCLNHGPLGAFAWQLSHSAAFGEGQGLIAGQGHGSPDVACVQPGSCIVFLRSTLV